MNKEFFQREISLIGEEAFERLNAASVILFGVGGVGGYAFEALVRGGIGHITVVDGDCVNASNINRQIIATVDSIGKKKVDVAIERARMISPETDVKAIDMFYLPENADEIDLSGYDYIIDAIDTVSAKIEIARRASIDSVPLISCMGTANRISTSGFTICGIYKTSGCPLARVMRRECKKRDIASFDVVYSPNESEKVSAVGEDGKVVPASISYVPPICGLIAAEKVIRSIAKI